MKRNHLTKTRPARDIGRTALGLLAAAALGLLGSCLEPDEAPLPVADTAAQVTWAYAGSFGGDVEIKTDSPDPWAVRFQPGGFKQVAGVCATADEVWVCDLGISRIEVFDFDGNRLRGIGSGVSIDGTLLSDEELYIEDRDFDNLAGIPRWEDAAGVLWRNDRNLFFKAADVLVTADGFLLADQAKTNVDRRSKRRARVVLIRWDGTSQEVGEGDCAWPAYLAKDGNLLAMSESPGNALWIGETTDQDWNWRNVTTRVEFDKMMSTIVERRNRPDYRIRMLQASGAGNKEKEFYGIGGVAAAFDKVIACDTGNHRLKVLEGRRKQSASWGTVLRIIPSRKDTGDIRFLSPLDIDIDATGLMYILDNERNEVAVLATNFDRVGGFGMDKLVTPQALDLSDDGRHCFITDARDNLVHHYVRTD